MLYNILIITCTFESSFVRRAFSRYVFTTFPCCRTSILVGYIDDKSCVEKLSVVPRLRNPQQVIGNL